MKRAKKKARMLWLSKDKIAYELRTTEPEWNKDLEWWVVGRGFIGSFGDDKKEFARLCPSLKLRKNTKCKVKLTQLKTGIKLEKV